MKIKYTLCLLLSLNFTPKAFSQKKVKPMLPINLSIEDKQQSDYKKLEAKFKDCCKSITDKIITPYNARKLYESNNPNIIFIDIRDDKEQDVSMIKGAIREKNFDKNNYKKDTTFIVYCTIGYRSGKLTKKLRAQGLNAYNLMGGIYGWTFYNGPIVDLKNQATKKVHIYSDSWNYLRKDYTAIK